MRKTISSHNYCNVKNYFFIIAFGLISQVFVGQQVKGIVLDSNGSPLPGVNIQEKGTTNGVASDFDGNYVITVKKNGTLVFTYLGYKTKEIATGEKSVLNITLFEDSQVLDEIIVIGYGSVNKRDLTGSVGNIKASKVLEGNPSPSINQALQGRLAGVSVSQNDGAPGAGISIQIRGANSFSTNTQPLYIVDGIPYDIAAMAFDENANFNNNQTTNALAGINPNDIESIEVLKDASATAIYGSRGSNGVIIITTKRGEKGSDKIEFTSNTTVSQMANKVQVLKPYEYALYRNEQYFNSDKYDGLDYTYLPFSGLWSYALDVGGNVDRATGEYRPLPEDYLSPGNYTDAYGNSSLVEGSDWIDGIFRTSFSKEYNLRVSGASDTSWYNFSGNHLNQEGTIKNTGYERLSLRVNIGRKVKDWLELGVNINYSNSLTDFTKSNSQDYGIIKSAMRFPVNYSENIGLEQSDELSWLASNPVTYVNSAKDRIRAINIFSSSYAEIQLHKNLKFRQNLGLSYSSNSRGTYYDRHTQEGRTPTNGKAGLSDTWYEKSTLESILTYDKKFNNNHRLNVVGGFTHEMANYAGKSLSATGFPTDLTGYYDISQGLVQNLSSSSRGKTSLMSLLGRVNYTLLNRYNFTVSFRRDGSSKFAENNKFANFASGAFSWRASEEEFIKKLNFFDNLKLRLSYGQTGNQGISAYQTQINLSTSNYPFGGSLSSGFSESTWRGALNPNLKWETTDQYNIGMDLSIFDSRLDLTVEYYHKKTRDLLQTVGIPSSSGFATMWTNSGNIVNSGLEITASYNMIDKENFKWGVDANISFNKNTIGGLKGDQFGAELWYGVDQFFIQRNGMPIGTMYGYVEDGFYDNKAEVLADPVNAAIANPESLVGEVKYRDINKDGAITAADQTVIGDASPDYTFGLTNNFTFKGFSLSFFFQGVIGNDLFNGNLTNIDMANIANIPEFAYNSRWIDGADNTNAKWPKAIRTFTRDMLISNRHIEDGSYIRLKNINLGYRFSPKFKGIDKVYLYGSASNLFTITNYSWFDPDINAFAGDASRRGVDIYSYPSSRTYSMGFNVEF
jgi:TonB-linked SusC/RagA family outer membrane protein